MVISRNKRPLKVFSSNISTNFVIELFFVSCTELTPSQNAIRNHLTYSRTLGTRVWEFFLS